MKSYSIYENPLLKPHFTYETLFSYVGTYNTLFSYVSTYENLFYTWGFVRKVGVHMCIRHIFGEMNVHM